MRVVVVTPPVAKPAEPGLSGAAAARRLRALGIPADSIDASIGWHRHALTADQLGRRLTAIEAAGTTTDGALLAFRRAIRNVTAAPPPLRRAATYRDRKVYTSAINHLENALRLAAGPGSGFVVRVAGLEIAGRRPERSADIAWAAEQPSPFDDYFIEELIPELTGRGATHVAVSLTFLDQAFPAARLARLLAERVPSTIRVLGGPLIACWAAVGVPFDQGPFRLFDRVLPGGSDKELMELAAELRAPEPERPVTPPPLDLTSGPLTVDLDAFDQDPYLAPVSRVPAALGRGCPWRRCTFCPDYIHPRHDPCSEDAVAGWLRRVADRFPHGAMLHLTDSALPPAHLERIATVIAAEHLPLRWHGFVRVEPAFADPDFARHLAAGGCAMLQFGVETASPRLLGLLGKHEAASGVGSPDAGGPALARRVIRSTHGAGIKNLVYLLFGLPTETEADRELTLAFVEEEEAAIQGINHALLNLPRGSAMHRRPDRFGITAIVPFATDTDLSLYDDFRCGHDHPRLEARQWLGRRFSKSASVRRIEGELRSPFKANHACFL